VAGPVAATGHTNDAHQHTFFADGSTPFDFVMEKDCECGPRRSNGKTSSPGNPDEDDADVRMTVVVGGGIQADDIEAVARADAVVTCPEPYPTPFIVDVTDSMRPRGRSQQADDRAVLPGHRPRKWPGWRC
jgi:hypothetical protein